MIWVDHRGVPRENQHRSRPDGHRRAAGQGARLCPTPRKRRHSPTARHPARNRPTEHRTATRDTGAMRPICCLRNYVALAREIQVGLRRRADLRNISFRQPPALVGSGSLRNPVAFLPSLLRRRRWAVREGRTRERDDRDSDDRGLETGSMAGQHTRPQSREREACPPGCARVARSGIRSRVTGHPVPCSLDSRLRNPPVLCAVPPPAPGGGPVQPSAGAAASLAGDSAGPASACAAIAARISFRARRARTDSWSSRAPSRYLSRPPR